MFPVIVGQWSDWQNGIPLGRRWLGRWGQNPRLLAAFAAVGRAYGRWQDSLMPKGGGGSIHEHPEVRALRGEQ